jgi:hypothetical protein
MKALIVLLFMAATARADVGVVVTGEATMQPQLAAQLESWLKNRGHQLAPSALDPDAINTLIDCFVIEDLGCARGVVEKRAKSQAIVFARVEVTPNEKDGTRDIALVGYWLQKGHDAIAERRVCSHCTEQSLTTTSEDLMAALAAEPPTASVQAAPQVDEGRPPSKTLPLALIGGGGLLLVAGTAMAIFGGPPSMQGPQEPSYRDYRTPGLVLDLTGAVAVGIGVYQWLHHGRH